MYKVTNIDGFIKTFDNDDLFINFTQLIYRENEEFTEWADTPVWPDTVDQCQYYINNYCNDLILTTS